jgi:hypothetical protein
MKVEVSCAPGKMRAVKPALLIYWTPGSVVKPWIKSEVAESVFMNDA